MKRLPAILLAASAAALTVPVPAAALPETMEAFDVQMEICRVGLEMIVDGASDDDEVEFYLQSLDENGWTESGDLQDLMLLCAFYKQGYLYALKGQ